MRFIWPEREESGGLAGRVAVSRVTCGVGSAAVSLQHILSHERAAFKVSFLPL